MHNTMTSKGHTTMGQHSGTTVDLLPCITRDLSSILTSGSLWSSSGRWGFLLHCGDVQVCGLVVSVGLWWSRGLTLPRGLGSILGDDQCLEVYFWFVARYICFWKSFYWLRCNEFTEAEYKHAALQYSLTEFLGKVVLSVSLWPFNSLFINICLAYLAFANYSTCTLTVFSGILLCS